MVVTWWQHGGNMVAAGGSAVSISFSRGCKASSKGSGGSPAAPGARASSFSAPGSIVGIAERAAERARRARRRDPPSIICQYAWICMGVDLYGDYPY